jgi:hypothetical protein
MSIISSNFAVHNMHNKRTDRERAGGTLRAPVDRGISKF